MDRLSITVVLPTDPEILRCIDIRNLVTTALLDRDPLFRELYGRLSGVERIGAYLRRIKAPGKSLGETRLLTMFVMH